MTKVRNIQTEKDKLIDRLIEDKNALYKRYKNLEREHSILKSQLRSLKKTYRELSKRHREVLNELLE